MQVCNLMAPSEHNLIQHIQQDKFYALLVPVTVPVTLVAVRFSLTSAKRNHNYGSKYSSAVLVCR